MAWQSVLLAGALLAGACATPLLAQLQVPRMQEVPFGEPSSESRSGPTLHEAFLFSQVFGNSPQEGKVSTSTISANVDYASGSVRRPFALLYAGGGIFTTETFGNTIYQKIQVTQGFVARNWNLTLANFFSYLPQAPTGGLSGIPGVGDLTGGGGGLIPLGIAPNQSVLAPNAPRYSDAVAADLERRVNSSTSLEGSGSFGFLRFPNGDGINNEQESGSIGINRRLNPLNILSADFSYARFQYHSDFYSPNDFSFTAPMVAADYKRQWNRAVASDISFGPQWVRSSDPALLPNTLLLAGRATLTFVRGLNSGLLGYSREAGGGSGSYVGAELDVFQAGLARNLQREWTLAGTLSWSRTAGLQTRTPTSGASSTGSNGSLILPPQSTVNAEYAAVQLTRRMSRHLTAFVTYTAQYQSIGYPPQSTPVASGTSGAPLNGLSNIVGFGFGYTPRERRIRR